MSEASPRDNDFNTNSLPVILVGIDWADCEHEFMLAGPDGEIHRGSFDQESDAVADFLRFIACYVVFFLQSLLSVLLDARVENQYKLLMLLHLNRPGEEKMGQNKLSGQEFRTSSSLNFSVKALIAVTILVATFFAGRVSMQDKVNVLENEMIESEALIDKLKSDNLELVADVAKTRNRIVELANRQFQKQNNQRDE